MAESVRHTSTVAGRRAVIYTRISLDKAGEGVGVERQRPNVAPWQSARAIALWLWNRTTRSQRRPGSDDQTSTRRLPISRQIEAEDAEDAARSDDGPRPIATYKGWAEGGVPLPRSRSMPMKASSKHRGKVKVGSCPRQREP